VFSFLFFCYRYRIYSCKVYYDSFDLVVPLGGLKLTAPVRRDVWRLFNYRVKTLYYGRRFRFSWKNLLNKNSFNPRKNFYGVRVNNPNFYGRRWNCSCFFHIIRRYGLYFTFYKRRARRFKFKFKKVLKIKKKRFFLFLKKRYFCFVLFGFRFWASNFGFFKNWKSFFLPFGKTLKSFFSFSGNLKKKNKVFLLNIWALEYYASHVQLNFNLQSGIYLGHVSLCGLRFPNLFYRSKVYSQFYLQYLLSV